MGQQVVSNLSDFWKLAAGMVCCCYLDSSPEEF